MTIIEASDKLLNWFSVHEFFNFKDNYKELLLLTNHVSLTEKQDEAAILLGLEELILNGYIKKITINKIDYFILLRPFNSFNQTLVLSQSTCLIISSVIKSISEILKIKDLVVNPLNIKEQDIILALSVLAEVSNIKQEIKQEVKNN